MAQSGGHDAPRLIGVSVPGEAAMIEDVVLGFEDGFDSQSSRMNRQTSSTGLSSGHLGGSGSSVMLAGMTRPAERCQPA